MLGLPGPRWCKVASFPPAPSAHGLTKVLPLVTGPVGNSAVMVSFVAVFHAYLA
jgi:hypothetical protein